ncbi:MAG: DNA polymerase III subunit epsilon [Paracoccaceae bacterium]
MREIVFDTETTGIDPRDGHRVVEIGAVELSHHVPTGRTFHEYLDPQCDMPAEAFAVHGLGDDFLRGQKLFAQVGQAFLDFVGDAMLIAHNAAFDLRFMNHELKMAGLPLLPSDRMIDTVAMARRKFPGSPASLDALARRYGIDTSARTLHGALLDSEILAEVYLELIGGKQPGLTLARAGEEDAGDAPWRPAPRPVPLPPRLTPAEAEAHRVFVTAMPGGTLWNGEIRDAGPREGGNDG